MERTRSLTKIAAFLADMASQFDVAVVVINQMTTKVGENDTSKLVPALGESWGHAVTTRVLLSGDDIRRCTLVKSPHKAAGSALYRVVESGIRDVPDGTTDVKRPRTN
jgi:RAD51-like protein 2